MRIFDIGASDEPHQASNRIWTVPNLLSLARLAVLPFVFVDLVNGRHLRALILLALFATTDWFDGYLARRLNQVTKLGAWLDPVSDRALLLVVGIGFVVADVLPLWALVLLLARDVVVLLVGAFVLAKGQDAPQVTKIGKTATFVLMFAFPAFLLTQIVAGGWVGVVDFVAWGLYWIGAVLYYIAAGQYAQDLLVRTRSSRD